MLTLKQCRKIDPSLDYLSDEELLLVRDQLYELSQLAFEEWWAKKQSSKNPVGDSTFPGDALL